MSLDFIMQALHIKIFLICVCLPFEVSVSLHERCLSPSIWSVCLSPWKMSVSWGKCLHPCEVSVSLHEKCLSLEVYVSIHVKCLSLSMWSVCVSLYVKCLSLSMWSVCLSPCEVSVSIQARCLCLHPWEMSVSIHGKYLSLSMRNVCLLSISRCSQCEQHLNCRLKGSTVDWMERINWRLCSKRARSCQQAWYSPNLAV